MLLNLFSLFFSFLIFFSPLIPRAKPRQAAPLSLRSVHLSVELAWGTTGRARGLPAAALQTVHHASARPLTSNYFYSNYFWSCITKQTPPPPPFSSQTHAHRHFNLGSNAGRGPGWSTALGSSSPSVFSLAVPVPLAHSLFISFPVLFFFCASSFHLYSSGTLFGFEQQHNLLNREKKKCFVLWEIWKI